MEVMNHIWEKNQQRHFNTISVVAIQNQEIQFVPLTLYQFQHLSMKNWLSRLKKVGVKLMIGFAPMNEDGCTMILIFEKEIKIL